MLSELNGTSRHWGFTGRTAVTAHNPNDAAQLAGSGATVVLEPFLDASEVAAHTIRSP